MLTSVFSALSSNAAPIYIVEMAPPNLRGTVGGTYQTLWYLGSLVAAFTCYGTELNLTGHIQWRLPLWLQLMFPAIVLVCIPFMPESPRWLTATNKLDKARKIVAKYHANGDDTHPLVDLEMAEMISSLHDKHLENWRSVIDYRKLFSSRSNRYRTCLIIAISWFGQFSGNNISSFYLPQMLTAVGIESVSMKILLNAIYAITGWISALSGARCHDIFGRRKMMMGATLAMSLWLGMMAVCTAVYQKTESHAVSSANIFFIYMFGATFAFGFTPIQALYATEVSSNELRAKSMGLANFVSSVSGFVNQFAAPVALSNISYWFYVFFVFWDLIEFAVIYFFFVETKDRTLEELTAVFESANPRKASTRLTTE
jgi:sugar porter (SP) family MFS transporter